MKRVFVAAALVLAPVSAQAAPGEVPLHIEATGEVPPDIVMFGLTQQAQAPSQAAANSALEHQHGALLKRLGELGVRPADIDWTRDAIQSPSTGDSMTDVASEGEASKPPAPVYSADATARITLRDTSKLPAVMTAMAALPDPATVSSRDMHYSFTDERAARALAVQRGFATARHDAEAYAAAAQMKIARIERISSARSPFSATDMQQFIAKFAGVLDRKSFPGDVFSSVTAAVVVDYVLVP